MTIWNAAITVFVAYVGWVTYMQHQTLQSVLEWEFRHSEQHRIHADRDKTTLK